MGQSLRVVIHGLSVVTQSPADLGHFERGTGQGLQLFTKTRVEFSEPLQDLLRHGDAVGNRIVRTVERVIAVRGTSSEILCVLVAAGFRLQRAVFARQQFGLVDLIQLEA